ncbi:hypothetical protein HDU78_008009 [Chytriomyces hyalinus]|nr:hypothetical protein HDU78_008009 [Chytriomyces hyalinus]
MRGPRPKKVIIKFAVGFFGIVGIIVAVILISTHGYNNSSQSRKYPVASASWDVGNGDRIAVAARVIAVDLIAQTAKFQYSVFPSTSIHAKNVRQSNLYELNVPVNLSFGSSFSVYEVGHPLLIETTTLPIIGDSYLYPLDYWECQMEVFATYIPANSSHVENLPVVLQISGSPNGFDIDYHFGSMNTDNDALGTDVYLELDIHRSTATKAFAIFISTIMWMLVLSAVTLASRLLAFEKRVDPPHIAFTTSLLFALPGLRNAMPDAPDIGILLDQVCLVWGMGLQSACLLVYYARFIAATRPDGWRWSVFFGFHSCEDEDDDSKQC